MGKPAARVGDSTAHGGAITGPGCPTVLIGGMPAARIGDMQACPLVAPAPAPVPHATGPISLGSAGVLIGGMPAARMGDMATCVGPPTTIAMGCPTVLIGEAGGGGGGGSGGGGVAKAASEGAHSALVGTPGESSGQHWIEYEFVDTAGNPVSGVSYEFTDVDGKVEKDTLKGNGRIKRGGYADEGECKLKLFCVHNAKWSKNEADVGDELKLTADTEGYEDGTKAIFKIYKKDNDGADNYLTEIEKTVSGNKVEAEWIYEPVEDEDDIEDGGEEGYSSPEYYFIVHVERDKAKSGLLEFKDWIEIELEDDEGNTVADEPYRVTLPNGEVNKGKLDSKGYKKIEKTVPGRWSVEFPESGTGIVYEKKE